MSKRIIFGQVLENWRKFADGKKTIIYCASIDLSEKTAKQFEYSGVSAVHLDGDTPKERRKRVIQDFRDGKITVLSNVELFGEGFDVPDCECVVLLRPTMSLTLHIQQSMRSMRYKENKTAIIIDNVGNVYRHGLPDDEREWSLQGKRRKEKFEIRIKQCPKCLSCMPGNARACSVCGYEFAVTETERAEMENINTELQRIQAEDILKSKLYNEYRNIDNWEEIERFRKAKKI